MYVFQHTVYFFETVLDTFLKTILSYLAGKLKSFCFYTFPDYHWIYQNIYSIHEYYIWLCKLKIS